MAAFVGDVIHYRITGKQSVERLDPLIEKLSSETEKFVSFGVDVSNEYSSHRVHELLAESSSISTLIVWETTCEKELRGVHQSAVIRNKLPNSQVLESKANFAFLQQEMPSNRELTTYVAKSGKQVCAWAQKRWDTSSSNGQDLTTSDWWVVKASNGNGGRDIWMIHRDNYLTALDDLPDDHEYVIQRYVNKPLLWQGTKKFHFRCYAFMQENGAAWLYDMAFILSAGWEYNTEGGADPRRHVTNLSVNKHLPHHPGQVPCNIPSEYPDLYPSIVNLWKETVVAAWPFVRCPSRSQQQQNDVHDQQPQNFEFCGLDVIADEDGRCWLIEINRLPGLESSKNNKVVEDNMYDRMMMSLLQIVLRPLLPSPNVATASASDVEQSMWREVWPNQNNGDSVLGQEVLLHNMLRWKLHIKRHRAAVLAEFN